MILFSISHFYYYVASVWILYLCCNICIPTGIRERKKGCGHLRKIKIQSRKVHQNLCQPKSWYLGISCLRERKKRLGNIGLGLTTVVFDTHFYKLYPLEIYFYSGEQQSIDSFKTDSYTSYNLFYTHCPPSSLVTRFFCMSDFRIDFNTF